MLDTVAFWTFAGLALGSGIGVFRVDSMARATLLLLASFVFGAGVLFVLGLAYLGALTVLMMAVEMAIMAVFMIMYMMNPAGLMPMAMLHNRRGALAISIGTFALQAAGILVAPWPRHPAPEPLPDPTRALGAALMGDRMLMMAIGVALLATMIAAILLATHRGRYDRYGDDLDRPHPDDPIPGGAGR